MSGTRCLFVRHAQSTANAEGWLAGHRDVPLTEAGVLEARALRVALAALAPERVVSSDLWRTRETARLSWGDRSPTIEITPALRERHVGAWEGRKLTELRASGEMAVLMSFDGAPPGGESHRTLAVRALTWLAANDDGRSMLLFSHGGLIRTVVGLLDGMPLEEIGSFKIGNTEISERLVPRGRFAELLDGMRL